MYMNKFDQIVKEYFDLSDSYTRHYFATLDEADQGSVLDALSSALYDKIVARVDDIDFIEACRARERDNVFANGQE